jgi:hypothetical protein
VDDADDDEEAEGTPGELEARKTETKLRLWSIRGIGLDGSTYRRDGLDADGKDVVGQVP